MNYLKIFRKKSKLTQDDIAYIFEIQKSSISRYEKGKRLPPLPIILFYHLLFNVSLSTLFKYMYFDYKQRVLKRTKDLIELLNEDSTSPRAQERISYLQNVVNRIGCLQEINDEKKRKD